MCSGRRSATLPRQRRGGCAREAKGLGRVWHARGSVKRVIEIDPLLEERAAGVLGGGLLKRRLRWHAVRGAPGRDEISVHPRPLLYQAPLSRSARVRGRLRGGSDG